MDKKFLNRVTNMIVNETEIDYHNYKNSELVKNILTKANINAIKLC